MTTVPFGTRGMRIIAALPPLLFVLALLLCPARVAAQVPPVPPDTVTVPDTTAGRQKPVTPDTLATAADSALAQDSVPAAPAKLFPSMPIAPAASISGGTWVWDREALLREAPMTVLDLLERIPAVATFRGGVYGQPEAASAWGGTAGRVEIVMDGFVLDPLAGSTYDLSQVSLGQLRELRVERRLGLLRIHLVTEQPTANQPYTRVEAGVGEPDANMFRGLFLVPYAVFGPLGLGIERMDTDGTLGAEPANVFTGWGKWSWTGDRRGVQLEARRTTLRREGDVPWPVERMRQDLIMRLRNRFTDALTAEVYAGVSQMEEKPVDAGDDDEDDVARLERDAIQAGVRVGYALPWGVVGGAVRFRDLSPLPRTEALLDADLGFGPLRVGGEFGQSTWEDRDATTYSSAHAQVGPFAGLSAFGEFTSGDRGAPVYRDTSSVVDSRTGWRAGLAASIGSRATGSVAYVSLDRDAMLPFGLPFDSSSPATTAGKATAIEAHGRLVILRDLLAIESWITDWQDLDGWVYTPVRTWRTALELHTVPLESGNLEILARLEGAQRSGTLAYSPPGEPAEGEEISTFAPLSSYTVFNGYLQIRIIDVRAFLSWEDVLGQEIEQLPGRFRRGPRIMYGVKWNLWN